VQQRIENQMIRVLLACSDKSFRVWAGCPMIGRLLTPVLRTSNLTHAYEAMDNFAYTNWSPIKFKKMLLTYSYRATEIKWVACPDVVGDMKATLKRFSEEQINITRLGYKLALVLQDGCTSELPWDKISCVFLGGTDDFKLSQDALDLCIIAKEREKLVHIGRVNSITRVERFARVMDSFDGLSYSFYSRANLPKVLDYLKELNSGR
jgi:hypothetical protein